MSLDDLVNITISADTTTPTKPGFGTIVILANKVPTLFPGTETVTYTSLTAMTDDGFLVTDPAYLCATKIFSQKVRPTRVKVWKRSAARPTVKTYTLQCLSAVEGDKYNLTVNGTALTYTVLASATTTTVATAIEPLVEAVTGIDSTSATDTITVTKASASAAGTLFAIKDWSSNIALSDTTADPGIATDLAALLAADSDFYGVALDSNSKAETLAAAIWVEANKKLAVFNDSDYLCMSSGSTTDALYVAKGLGYARSGWLFNGNDTMSYSGAAWMGGRFPFPPGSYTWMFKSIAGVSPDPLTGNQQSAIENKHGNTYTTVAGVNMTAQGTSASGEFLDITQGIDWLRAEIQTRVFGRLVNLPKVPFTDLGVDIILSEIQGALQTGVNVGFLDPGNGDDIAPPTATGPRVADVSSVDRAARHLPGLKFSAKMQGAVHDLDINGTLTV